MIETDVLVVGSGPAGASAAALLSSYSVPDEIGNTVAFVCSELASSITGAAIRVDGGAVKACF
nr:SDR family oxidoreductase [Paraburkholderia sp.]